MQNPAGVLEGVVRINRGETYKSDTREVEAEEASAGWRASPAWRGEKMVQIRSDREVERRGGGEQRVGMREYALPVALSPNRPLPLGPPLRLPQELQNQGGGSEHVARMNRGETYRSETREVEAEEASAKWIELARKVMLGKKVVQTQSDREVEREGGGEQGVGRGWYAPLPLTPLPYPAPTITPLPYPAPTIALPSNPSLPQRRQNPAGGSEDVARMNRGETYRSETREVKVEEAVTERIALYEKAVQAKFDRELERRQNQGGVSEDVARMNRGETYSSETREVKVGEAVAERIALYEKAVQAHFDREVERRGGGEQAGMGEWEVVDWEGVGEGWVEVEKGWGFGGGRMWSGGWDGGEGEGA